MSKLILVVILALAATPTAYAASEVRVNVSSNTSSNQSSTSKVENNTHIRINTNGDVKEYNGSDGNIEVKSDDGKTSVSVKNNEATNNKTTTSNINSKTNIVVNSDTLEASPSSSPVAEATVAGIFKDNTIEAEFNTGFWEHLIKKINAIFEGIF